jgi:hypothetical protein
MMDSTGFQGRVPWELACDGQVSFDEDIGFLKFISYLNIYSENTNDTN